MKSNRSVAKARWNVSTSQAKRLYDCSNTVLIFDRIVLAHYYLRANVQVSTARCVPFFNASSSHKRQGDNVSLQNMKRITTFLSFLGLNSSH